MREYCSGLPRGAVVTDQNGRQIALGGLRNRNDPVKLSCSLCRNGSVMVSGGCRWHLRYAEVTVWIIHNGMVSSSPSEGAVSRSDGRITSYSRQCFPARQSVFDACFNSGYMSKTPMPCHQHLVMRVMRARHHIENHIRVSGLRHPENRTCRPAPPHQAHCGSLLRVLPSACSFHHPSAAALARPACAALHGVNFNIIGDVDAVLSHTDALYKPSLPGWLLLSIARPSAVMCLAGKDFRPARARWCAATIPGGPSLTFAHLMK